MATLFPTALDVLQDPWATVDDRNTAINAIESLLGIAGANVILKSLIDAKGDLIVGTADNTPTRLAVGANGKVPIADSTQATGIEWRALAKAELPSAIAYEDEANSFTLDQAIAVAKNLLFGDSGGLVSPGSNGSFNYVRNAKWDGVNWVRTVADAEAGRWYFNSAGDLILEVATDAGNTVGSTITWTERGRISYAGVLTLTGAGTARAVGTSTSGLFSARPTASAALEGSIYYATDVKVMYQCISSAWQAVSINQGLASITARVSAAAGSTADVQILSYTIPANFLSAGTVYRLTAAGTFTAPSDASPTQFSVKARLGSTALATVGATGPASTAITDKSWFFEGLITVRSTGAGGTLIGAAQLNDFIKTAVSGTNPVFADAATATTAIDTTASNTISVAMALGETTAGYSAKAETAAIELVKV